MKKSLISSFLIAGCVICPVASHAVYQFKNGKLVKTQELATLSVQEHYSLAMQAYEAQHWDELIHQMLIVMRNFSDTPFALDAYYYLGVAYYHQEEWEYSNRFFSKYLKKQISPKYFEEAIGYKFNIAQKYHHGAKKHVFGVDALPKWLPAKEDAVALYEEVIVALPHHDLAAQALFSKGQLLLKDQEYKASIETYQTLIRRFPKHPLAAEAYIGITEVYLSQSQQEYPDQDYLDSAQINVRKFRQDFPSNEKVSVAESVLLKMKEVYASDLYDVARFYERIHKPQAAYIYYTRIMAKYPETQVANLATKRLGQLDYEPSLPLQEPPASVEPAREVLPSPLLELSPEGHRLTVEADVQDQ